MIVKINKNELRTIITESIIEVMNEMKIYENGFNMDDISHGQPIIAGQLVYVTDNEEKKKYYKTVWDMLELSYEPLGGLQSYHSYNHFLKCKPFMKIVIKNGGIIACSTYIDKRPDFKMTAIGCDQTPLGKLALQQIVQDDIINADCHYWAEVSDAVEHYFKKYNGFPIPSAFAAKLLNLTEKDITPLDDKVHYIRNIGDDNLPYTKMIYGFENEDIYNAVVKEIDDYGTFMRDVNGTTTLNEMENDELGHCEYVIENLLRMFEENYFNEFIPSWYKALKDCRSVIYKYQDSPNREYYLDVIDYLFDCVTELTLNTSPLFQGGIGGVDYSRGIENVCENSK